MEFRNLAVGILALIIVAACTEPTVDTHSDESIKQSVSDVREALPEAKRSDFDEAIQILLFSELDLSSIFGGDAVDESDIDKMMRQSLDGKTGEQIISEAAVIKVERQAREKQQAIAEIKELEEKKLASEQASEALKKFTVERSRFYMKEQRYGGPEPIIELTVKNNTKYAVSRAYFEGTIASPNRSVPWLKETFNYSIAGGIEPGEEASWSLAPNMFSEWGTVDAPSDAVFTVTVERLDGADNEALFSKDIFDDYDQKRLQQLKDEFEISG